MTLTEEQQKIGRENFSEAVSVTRRDFLKGAGAGAVGLGAFYFGYRELQGERIRVGFIGTGDEGNVLITQHPKDYMDIVAVADLRPTSRRITFHGEGNDARIGLVKKLGAEKASKIEQFNDHLSLIEAKERLGLQAVVIAVPLIHHASIAMAAMDADLHVLTEKLMAHNIRQCKEMIRKARDKKLLLAVGHQRHYSVLYDNAASIIRSGALGDIKFIRAQWHRNNSFPGGDQWNKPVADEDITALKETIQQYGYESVDQLIKWRLFNKTGGGIMAELGSHQMDACSIFLGKVHPLAVQGYGGKNFYGVKGVGSRDKQEDPRDIDDHVYVTYEFPGPNYQQDNNDIAIATYSSINTNSFEPYGEMVLGSRGTLILRREQEAMLYKEEGRGSSGGGPDQRLWVVAGQAGSGPVLQAYETTSGSAQASGSGADWASGISRGYTEEMEHFCYCISQGIVGREAESVLRCSGPVAMADAIMALTANRAMAHKRRIVFEDAWFDPDRPETPEASHPLPDENPQDFLA